MCDVGLQQPSKPRNQNRTIVLHQPPGLEMTDHEITDNEVREVNKLPSIYRSTQYTVYTVQYG